MRLLPTMEYRFKRCGTSKMEKHGRIYSRRAKEIAAKYRAKTKELKEKQE